MRKISIILSGIFLHCSLQAQTTFQYYYHNYYSLSHVVGCTVVPINNEGYAISGFLLIPVGTWRAYIIKLDNSGNIQWSKTIGNINFEAGYSIIQTRDSGYAITGAIESSSTNVDVYVIKLNIAGNLQWTRTINRTVQDLGYSIIQS